jgi:hypothetical protein
VEFELLVNRACRATGVPDHFSERFDVHNAAHSAPVYRTNTVLCLDLPQKRFLDRINKMDKIQEKAVAESGLEIFLPVAHPL